MTPSAMADRLMIYADAIAGFSIVNTLAFMIALAEPDVRCSLVGASSWIYVGIGIGALIQAGAIVLLRRGEIALRAQAGQELEPGVQRTMRYVQIGRIALICLYNLILLGLLYQSSSGADCAL